MPSSRRSRRTQPRSALLKSTVTDLKAANASAVSSLSDEQAAIKKSIANPDAYQLQGNHLSPQAASWRLKQCGARAPPAATSTPPFTGVPLSIPTRAAERVLRHRPPVAHRLKAIGKVACTLTGYYEVDWLGTGITSNNNQSNSYMLRQRQLWADAKLNNGWDFSGGQGWSLATETTQGLTRGTEILPATIDAQYTAGFVWTRQYSFRVIKDFGKKFFRRLG